VGVAGGAIGDGVGVAATAARAGGDGGACVAEGIVVGAREVGSTGTTDTLGSG
jgi:hypothetical protein